LPKINETLGTPTTGIGPAAAPGSATIAMIAGEVGVSVTTVSKVLNGRADVAPGTRARVEACLERHRYRRRSRRHPAGVGQVDLVFHEFDSAWAMEIIRGVEAVTAAAKVEVVLSQLSGKHRPTQEWLDGVLARRPLGALFVLCGPTQAQQQQLRRQRIPFVVVAPESTVDTATPSGADIEIEDRGAEEVVRIRGVPVAPHGTDAANPAFDVTPSRLVTGFITERGIAAATREGLLSLYPERLKQRA